MHARNMKIPNFGRWMTIFPALELFLDNWTINYFIAVAIKQSMPSTSSLSQYACTLIGLMNTATASGPPGTKLREDQCPPLYAEGLFVRAFGDAYFKKHFEWLLWSDPEFGHDSYGQAVRLYPERVYIMKKELDDLINGGWQEREEYAPYLKAVD